MNARIVVNASLVVLALGLALLASSPVYAGTWYVDDDAPNDPGPGDPNISDPLEDGLPEHPFNAIQEGIDAASDDDEVVVLDGIYTGDGNKNLDFESKEITVRSQSGHARCCVIDCEGAGRGFYFHTGETEESRVESIAIRNGDANLGGAIYCCDKSSPAIAGCIICQNSAFYGGGISCHDSSPTIIGCVITGNRAYKGDGGGVCCTVSEAVLRSCTISGNSARGNGGGIYSSGHPYLENTILWGNCVDWGVGDEWYWRGHLHYCCCNVDRDGVEGSGSRDPCLFPKPNIDGDPLCCDPEPCENAPTCAGDYHLLPASPCCAEANPECGLIGALCVTWYYFEPAGPGFPLVPIPVVP